jgi:quercetin dioxygenase-like cupin family protein
MRWLVVAAGVVASLSLPVPALAQQAPAPVARVPLQTFDVPGTGYQTLMILVDIRPDVVVERHTHPGVEASYVVEGDLVLRVEGQPERSFRAGDSFQVPAGIPHGVRLGPNGARLLTTYVVETGKPLTTPAP